MKTPTRLLIKPKKRLGENLNLAGKIHTPKGLLWWLRLAPQLMLAMNANDTRRCALELGWLYGIIVMDPIKDTSLIKDALLPC